MIQASFSALGHRVPEGAAQWDAEIIGWKFAAGHIPLLHLEECFRRAMHAKRDTRPLCAVDVNKEWSEYKLELARRGATNELQLLLAGRKESGASKLLTFSEWVEKHSPENTSHNEETCAICHERRAKGQPPVSTLTRANSGFDKIIGTQTRYEAEAEARAALDRFRAERKAEGFRPLQDVPPEEPIFDGSDDLSDLPF